MPRLRRVQDLLEGAVERPEVLRAARAQRALRHWPEAVGPLLAEKAQPDRYDHGTLWVATSGSAWAQEIRLRQETILARLNQLAGERSLFLQLRAGVRPARRAWTTDAPRPTPPLSPATPEDTEQAPKPVRRRRPRPDDPA